MKKKKALPKKNGKKAKKAARKKKVAKAKKSVPRKKATPKRKKAAARARNTRAMAVRGNQEVELVPAEPKGLGTRSGVGAGDYQGTSLIEDVDSESEEELLEEGQAFEAGVIRGVENAPDPDEGEVRTHEVLEDDVPLEYDDKDRL